MVKIKNKYHGTTHTGVVTMRGGWRNKNNTKQYYRKNGWAIVRSKSKKSTKRKSYKKKYNKSNRDYWQR